MQLAGASSGGRISTGFHARPPVGRRDARASNAKMAPFSSRLRAWCIIRPYCGRFIQLMTPPDAARRKTRAAGSTASPNSSLASDARRHNKPQPCSQNASETHWQTRSTGTPGFTTVLRQSCVARLNWAVNNPSQSDNQTAPNLDYCCMRCAMPQAAKPWGGFRMAHDSNRLREHRPNGACAGADWGRHPTLRDRRGSEPRPRGRVSGASG